MRFRSTQVLSALLATIFMLSGPAVWGQSVPAPHEAECCVSANPHNSSWLTTGEPKAIVLCIHGLGLCSSGFANFGMYLAERGFHCVAVDIRGFGNENEPEKVDFNQSLTDLRDLLAKIHDHYPGKPVFVAGESLGGSMAIRLAALEDGNLAGVICSAPGWKIHKQKRTVVKAVLSWAQPKGDLPWIAETFIDAATNNQQLKDHWLQDPHHRMHLSPKEQLRLNKFVKHTPDFIPGIAHTPVLFVQGLHDRLVDQRSVAQLFAALPNQDKQFMLVSGAEHLILEEGQGDGATFNQIADWISGKRFADAPAGVLLSSKFVPTESIRLFDRARVQSRFVVDPGPATNAAASPCAGHL